MLAVTHGDLTPAFQIRPRPFPGRIGCLNLSRPLQHLGVHLTFLPAFSQTQFQVDHPLAGGVQLFPQSSDQFFLFCQRGQHLPDVIERLLLHLAGIREPFQLAFQLL